MSKFTPLLKGQAFDPELVEAMGRAFVSTCRALGLTDRTDAMTALVAKKIIQLAQRGLRNPTAIHLLAIKEFRSDGKGNEPARVHSMTNVRPFQKTDKPPEVVIKALLLCPTCNLEMSLYGTESESAARDLYTFECSACDVIEVRGVRVNTTPPVVIIGKH